MPIFSKRLRESRINKGLSVSQLSKELGVSSTTIRNWESTKCKPTIDHLRNLVLTLKVSCDYLTGLK